MILLVATICLQSELTLDCRTEVVRVERTPVDCIQMVVPVGAWLQETYSPAWMVVTCKSGVFG